jgi:hypothetical protein
MRNDVGVPPEDPDVRPLPQRPVSVEVNPPNKPTPKPVSPIPVPPADGPLKADVELFDHPAMNPSGAGNFWSLSLFGLIIAVIAVIVLWMFSGYMR